MYSRAWTVFRDFYEHFVSPHSIKLPLSTATIALFISYLRARKLAASTITSYLSAISYVHKMKGLRDPTKAFLIQKLLIAVSKQRSPDTRLPITKPVLFQLVRSLQHTNSSAVQRTLFTAMFLTAFYGFFRIGELASKSPESGDSVVQFKSLSFLCLVLVEPKAPCYRAHMCVRNSGFSRILRQQPETTFEQCSFDFRIPRRHDVDAYFLLRSLHVLTLRVCSTTLVSFLCLR